MAARAACVGALDQPQGHERGCVAALAATWKCMLTPPPTLLPLCRQGPPHARQGGGSGPSPLANAGCARAQDTAHAQPGLVHALRRHTPAFEMPDAESTRMTLLNWIRCAPPPPHAAPVARHAALVMQPAGCRPSFMRTAHGRLHTFAQAGSQASPSQPRPTRSLSSCTTTCATCSGGSRGPASSPSLPPACLLLAHTRPERPGLAAPRRWALARRHLHPTSSAFAPRSITLWTSSTCEEPYREWKGRRAAGLLTHTVLPTQCRH